MTFFPTAKGTWERVAYGEEPDYDLVFAISARSSTGYEANVASFEDMVRAYRETGPMGFTPWAESSPLDAPPASNP
ncbi:MAG: hypothetical protein R3F35_24570 [Myxococcota bacterium]